MSTTCEMRLGSDIDPSGSAIRDHRAHLPRTVDGKTGRDPGSRAQGVARIAVGGARLRPVRLTRFARCLAALGLSFVATCLPVHAGPDEQARRIHDRLAGVPPTAQTLNEMAALIAGAADERVGAVAAARLAMDHPDFYRTTLKNLATPWTNRDRDVFAPLNDYTATFIGIVRDDRDIRELLTADYLYVATASAGVPGYSRTDNNHYETLESRGADLAAVREPHPQSNLLAIPASAAAGVMTSRAASRAFFIAGTNRAMLRFTLLNHLCLDLEEVADVTRTPDRIRQDVTRSPGGDSRVFRNNCIGCHSGMDPLAQAFAYYNYAFDVEGDPQGLSGQLRYNDVGQFDSETGSRVVAKYHFNAANFPFGFVTPDENWSNYWREGPNQVLGWSGVLPGSGSGARSMGEELAGSEAFARCQVTKVFRAVCLREPADSTDRTEIASMTSSLQASGYELKQVFAETAAFCRGE